MQLVKTTKNHRTNEVRLRNAVKSNRVARIASEHQKTLFTSEQVWLSLLTALHLDSDKPADLPQIHRIPTWMYRTRVVQMSDSDHGSTVRTTPSIVVEPTILRGNPESQKILEIRFIMHSSCCRMPNASGAISESSQYSVVGRTRSTALRQDFGVSVRLSSRRSLSRTLRAGIRFTRQNDRRDRNRELLILRRYVSSRVCSIFRGRCMALQLPAAGRGKPCIYMLT